MPWHSRYEQEKWHMRVIVSSREEDAMDSKRIRMDLRTIVHSLLPDQETYSVAVRRSNLHLPI